MATLSNTPARELSDSELRKRLLTLGYDVPVSVNREFLVKKLENASAQAVGGGGGRKSNKRHSMAATPRSPEPQPGTPGSERKQRRSMAVTPGMNSMSPPGTPQQYVGSPASMSSLNTPSTPSPFVSRLGTPSPGSSPNGDASHSPRYMNYLNMFSSGGSDGNSGGDGQNFYKYRSVRMSAPPGSFSPVTSVAPPSRSERNGYSTSGQSGGHGVDSGWWSGLSTPTILVVLFIAFFVGIGVFYIKLNMAVDPRGLTAEGGFGQSSAQVPPKPPPVPPKKKELPVVTSMNYPVCGLKGVDPNACVSKDVIKTSRTLFNALKDELTQRGRKVGCHSDVQEKVTLQDAKSILYKLTDLRKSDVDLAFEGMLLLVTENPRGGLHLISPDGNEDIGSREVASLDLSLTKITATGVNPDFVCGVKAMFFSLTLYGVLMLMGLLALAGGWKGFKFYRTRKEREQDEIYKMVEKILELLFQHKQLSDSNQGNGYLAINHVRDELIPPKERLRKDAFWNKVVDYIGSHESRVREEIQHISGEEFKVWRWIETGSPIASKRFSRFSMPRSPPGMTSTPNSASPPGPSHANMSPSYPPQAASLYPSLSGLSNSNDDEDEGIGGGDSNSNNKWQGQAFETCEGSPNALPSTPTTCLKIRHMVAEKDGAKERSRIEKHILEKCHKAKILHIGIDQSSVEGCVYIRCSTKEDARLAFMALHGWWFEGKLLSVKFLREERYFSRFPEAKSNTVPLSLK